MFSKNGLARFRVATTSVPGYRVVSSTVQISATQRILGPRAVEALPRGGDFQPGQRARGAGPEGPEGPEQARRPTHAMS